jgi:GAF domain-containing protein
MALADLVRRVRHDPETRALRALARGTRTLPARRRPEVALQLVSDLARSLTKASYAALAVTDEHDYTEGFVVSGLDDVELRYLKTPPQGHGPLGSLRLDGHPVRYEDVREHARAFGFPSNHPEMQRLMGVAIWANGEVRGALYVTDRRDGKPFDDDDERVLITLADHASKVIETEWY